MNVRETISSVVVKKARNYVNGEWVEPRGCEWLDIENPSTGEIIGEVPLSSTEQTNEAIDAAHAAFPAWAATPVDKRVAPLFILAGLIRDNHEKICRVLSEEMGKSLPDARAEMDRTLENVEVACGMPIIQQGDKLIGAAPGVDGEVIRLPLGVFTMIAPFNFPGMVPFWFLPYAIASGNTFVLKPSKQVPLTMQLITEYIDQCGLPDGVFNMVCGDRVVADAFMEHPDVRGVSVVGSSPVCQVIANKCAANNKRFQGMGAAKNHLVVMEDAKVDDVIRNLITSGYGCAGQRCMASSVIITVGQKIHDQILPKYLQAARDVVVADPLNPDVAGEQMLMGPVISAEAKKFVEDMIETGVKEGATLALDGRGLEVSGCENGHFLGTSVFTDVKEGMEVHNIEIFGPVQSIMNVDTLDDAIKIINNHAYGNGCSLYTQNGYWARKFKIEALSGMIGINVGIPAPVAYLPFGGMKQSQFADIKTQGVAAVRFFTEDKIVTERFWPEED
ncbi:MAG: CoA-acylating methylmalonate-semialdehyde dehydrogenase [Alphaproteobacteria bacterium]